MLNRQALSELLATGRYSASGLAQAAADELITQTGEKWVVFFCPRKGWSDAQPYVVRRDNGE